MSTVRRACHCGLCSRTWTCISAETRLLPRQWGIRNRLRQVSPSYQTAAAVHGTCRVSSSPIHVASVRPLNTACKSGGGQLDFARYYVLKESISLYSLWLPTRRSVMSIPVSMFHNSKLVPSNSARQIGMYVCVFNPLALSSLDRDIPNSLSHARREPIYPAPWIDMPVPVHTPRKVHVNCLPASQLLSRFYSQGRYVRCVLICQNRDRRLAKLSA
jgi:hypothetical protein